MQFHVYILFSLQANKYYVGFTGDDLSERLRKHYTSHNGSTGGFSDWNIIYVENFDHKTDALKRENEIKSWKSRIKIQKLIGLKHPDL